MSDPIVRGALLLVGAAAAVPLVWALPALLRRLGLERTNYQGRSIAAGAGLLFLVPAAAWFLWGPRADIFLAVTVIGFGILGLIDDRWGTPEHKGLKGHLRALVGGRLTTGGIKAIGGLILAAALAWTIRPGYQAIAATLMIALCANAFNLLDLRPLRALKVFWLLTAIPIFLGPQLFAAVVGVSVPYGIAEARRRLMLGDAGSNALGALLGAAAAAHLRFELQVSIVLLLFAFHVWAEKFSLSKWIEAHGWARAIDRLGWND